MLNEETVIIPGHGAVAGIAELKALETMLKTVALRIEQLIADDKTAEKVIALTPSVKHDDAWAWSLTPPERFDRLVYDSLSQFGREACCGLGLARATAHTNSDLPSIP